ncbi:hypothetical protein FAVG1_09672 [Fusarium avenaceum]|nr:hypothetical protein FAVG1_09672 [Fusarium avenaceum]
MPNLPNRSTSSSQQGTSRSERAKHDTSFRAFVYDMSTSKGKAIYHDQIFASIWSIISLLRSMQPRKKKTNKDASRSSKREAQDQLALIWERLRRIEASTEKSESLPSTLHTPVAATSPHDGSCLASLDNASRSPSQYVASSSPIDRLPHAPALQLSLDDTTAFNPHDILSALNKAVDESLTLGKGRLANSKAYLMDDVTIPRETARMWVSNFFNTNGPRFYPSVKDEALIDAKLLHLLPDLIQMKHVHVDACFLVVYYCVLWQGHFMLDEVTASLKEQDPRLSRNIYISCLRAVSTWQRQASGSVTDFIAATLMAQVAAENLDFQLCWEMHRHACMWSEAMRLHSIDSDEASSQSLIATTDGGRMSMWNLVRMELFFRLISGKAPSFSFDLSEWHVNLPFLLYDEVDLQEAVPTTAFLAGSRVTLILIRFFQVIQGPDRQQDKLSLVISLCEQVEEIDLEWDIFGWQQSFKRETIDGWYLSELALGCCSSILFMLRMVSGQNHDQVDVSATSEQNSLCKETELRAARRIVLIVCHMTQVIRLPGPQSLSLALGMYCVQVAYATVVAHVLDQPKAATVGDDLLQLKRFGSCINVVASTASEFMPFARALRSVQAQLEGQVAQPT